MPQPLTAFAFVPHSNDREAWYECHTLRGGEAETCLAILPPDHARRLADRLCDRLGITDRGALYCGRVFWLRNGHWV
jgi:hypothetical protein